MVPGRAYIPSPTVKRVGREALCPTVKRVEWRERLSANSETGIKGGIEALRPTVKRVEREAKRPSS